MFTDKQLSEAAVAYVRASRLNGGNFDAADRAARQWAGDYPQHFSELKARLARALEAAHQADH